jgi:hypothetical protein
MAARLHRGRAGREVISIIAFDNGDTSILRARRLRNARALDLARQARASGRMQMVQDDMLTTAHAGS